MSNNESTNTLKPVVLAEIILLPLEEEDTDFETLSAVEDVTADVFTETTMLEGYESKLESNDKRSAGIIILLGEVAHQAIVHKDLIIAFLKTGVSAIGVLAKQRRVSKIEVHLDNDSISIENPDTTTVETLLILFEAKHPGIAGSVTSSSKLQVTGKVSKEERPAH